jgi:hypothetical protein
MRAPIPQPTYEHEGPLRSRALLSANKIMFDVTTASTAASIAALPKEAPIDGNTYSRLNAAWQKLSAAVIAGLPPV